MLFLVIQAFLQLTVLFLSVIVISQSPTFREIKFVLSILSKRSLTELTAQFLLENYLQMRLAPHLFCWRTSLIDALSSYVK